jgi:hypothetical protein
MAKTYNLEIDAGATYTVTFVYKNDDGVPFDLTDYTVQCKFKNLMDNFVLTPTMTKNALDGEVVLSLTATQTGTLVNSPYLYQIELHGPDAEVIRLVQGQVSVSPEVVK